MRKRSDRHKRNKTSFHKIIIIVSILLFITAFGSVTTLSADGGITSILQDWFNKQETEAIEEVDASIEEVQKEQTERLKNTLQEMLDGQKTEMEEVVRSEKAERAEALEEHADELIEAFKAEHAEANEIPTGELDAIMEEAKQQMDTVVEQEVSEATSEADEAG